MTSYSLSIASTVWAKTELYLKFATTTCDDREKNSIQQTVQLFLSSKTGILNVASLNILFWWNYTVLTTIYLSYCVSFLKISFLQNSQTRITNICQSRENSTCQPFAIFIISCQLVYWHVYYVLTNLIQAVKYNTLQKITISGILMIYCLLQSSPPYTLSAFIHHLIYIN